MASYFHIQQEAVELFISTSNLYPPQLKSTHEISKGISQANTSLYHTANVYDDTPSRGQ